MKKRIKYNSVNLNQNYKLTNNFVIAYFKITSKCTLNCPFCSQGKQSEKTISITEAKKVLYKLNKIGIKLVTYTGGEPLLFDHLEELLWYGKKLGFEQIIVTNGLLLKNVNKNIFKYIDGIGVSLHGNELIHDKVVAKKGTFKEVASNIDYVIKNYKNIKVNINCTITENNLNNDSLVFLKDFSKKREIKLSFGRLNYIGFSKETKIIDPNRYLPIISKLKEDYNNINISNCIALCCQDEKYNYLNHSCGAGQTMFAIEANGDIKICASSNVVIGNILKDSTTKILNSKKLKDFRKLKWLPMKCNNCKRFPLCKGGCHVENNGIFYNNNCDALLKNESELIWLKIKDKKLIIKNIYIIKKGYNKFLIVNNPLRITNKIGINIIKRLDGKTSVVDLEKEFNNIDNFREFIILLYNEGVLKENEKKTNR